MMLFHSKNLPLFGATGEVPKKQKRMRERKLIFRISVEKCFR